MAARKSSEPWRELYDSRQDKGCSKAAWCRLHALNYHPFLYWRDKFSEKQKKLIPVEASSSSESRASMC